MSLSVHFFRSKGQIANLRSEKKKASTAQHICREERAHMCALRPICESSYLCWRPLWPAWAELLGSGPAEAAGCTAATAGSSAGKTWRPDAATLAGKSGPGEQAADRDRTLVHGFKMEAAVNGLLHVGVTSLDSASMTTTRRGSCPRWFSL